VEINAFQRWNSDLANIVAHVGEPIFFQQVFAAIEAQGACGIAASLALPQRLAAQTP
jgi:hypothetical protein